jgi:3-oxoacyl-[acyl-carrier protein] reductase
MTGHQAAYDLTDRVAVVTGAASGIGAASARLLADAGAYVICADRDRDGAERTAKECDGRGEVLVLDVSDEQAVDDAATAVVAQRGRLDVWCNVAGIIETRPIADMNDAAFQRIFDVNFLGTLHGCRSALRVMTAGSAPGGGSIINLASAAIDTPAAGIAAYAISKAAVAQLTKTLAVEAGPANIRVNAIAPGFVISAMTSRHFTRPDGGIDEAARDQVVTVNSAMSPLGVVGEPDDIAHAVLYLAVPAAKFVTGQILRPNGGVAMPW